MLSTQLGSQYQGYLLQAKRLNSVLLDRYLPSVSVSTTSKLWGQSHYHELMTSGRFTTPSFQSLDQFTAVTGAVANIFASTRDGDFVHITTSLRNERNERVFAT